MEVLITTPSFGKQSAEPWEALARAGLSHRSPSGVHPLDAAQLSHEVARSSALIVGLDTVDAAVFAAAPHLKVVAKHGVGVDNIDCAAAAAAGVRVVNAPGSNSGAVADLTLGAMIAVARRLVPAHLSMLDGRWDRFPGVELAGRTLGLVGFGRIGQAVAKRAHAFDMTVAAYDPYLPAEVFTTHGVSQVELAECVAGADFLSLHMPGAPGSTALLDAVLLGSMKQGSYLINAARGGLVDEAVVATMLTQGHLAGAALDAFASEPLLRDAPLLTAPNVLLTPHIGAYTDRANAAMGTMVVADIARVLHGEEPLNAVV
ncbi:phosphoglycerate dehydrogenase [Kocuria sp. WN036]|uniref:phosphoglycerate dehydrogenase n=1 Tax=Kocuria sp. WN036 TaxID=2032628 RepID=UPI001C3EA464|nr:phosphoglycerate dehydrogenase [Kocuria sp. WN036]